MYNVWTMIEIFSYVNRQSSRLISTIASCVVDKTTPTHREIISYDFRGHIIQFRMRTHGREGYHYLCNFVITSASGIRGGRGEGFAKLPCQNRRWIFLRGRSRTRVRTLWFHLSRHRDIIFFFSQQGPRIRSILRIIRDTMTRKRCHVPTLRVLATFH